MAYIGKSPTSVPLTSSDVTDGIISTDKIAADAITEAKIADDAVLSAHMGAGDFTFPSGSLILGTSGKGIDFSAHGQASGMSSELLDDYEEGTFTGTIGAGTFSFSQNTGYYRKIGDLVYVQIYMVIDAYTSGSRVNIIGLPYTSRNDNSNGRYPVSVARIDNMNISSVAIFPFVHANGASIGCDGMTSSASSTTNNLQIWTDDTTLSFGGCYLAAS